MRIAKATLFSRWVWFSGLALAVFAVLAALDYRLKALTGVGTVDLAGMTNAAQFRAAFWAWGPEPYAVRAGFDLGLDYLLMPLYAAGFFYSGVIAAEAFAPGPSLLRRVILMAALAPFVGAAADACENALQLTMLLGGVTDTLAQLSSMASNIKNLALLIGLALFLGAVMAWFRQRQLRRQAAAGALKMPIKL